MPEKSNYQHIDKSKFLRKTCSECFLFHLQVVATGRLGRTTIATDGNTEKRSGETGVKNIVKVRMP
jgi:hypothetical protein